MSPKRGRAGDEALVSIERPAGEDVGVPEPVRKKRKLASPPSSNTDPEPKKSVNDFRICPAKREKNRLAMEDAFKIYLSDRAPSKPTKIIRLTLPPRERLEKKLKKLERKGQPKLWSRFCSTYTVGDPAKDSYTKRRFDNGGFTAPETFDSKRHDLKLHVTPFPTFSEPTANQCAIFFARVAAWEKEHFGIDIDAQGRCLDPDQEGKLEITADSIGRGIMAQSTQNDKALVVQDILRYRFPFFNNGREVIREVPNWHDIALCSQSGLKRVVRGAGLGWKRPLMLLLMLAYIYEFNEKRIMEENGGKLPDDVQRGQPPNVTEFVPGLLSLDFLHRGSKNLIWDFFLNMYGMSTKTAACFKSFHLGHEVFPVDVHVSNLSTTLGWVPSDAYGKPERMFRHLSAHVPKDSMQAIHQLMWYHGQHCYRCKNRITTPPSPDAVGVEVCPIEDLVDRSRKKVDSKQEKEEEEDDDEVEVEQVEVIEVTETVEEVQTTSKVPSMTNHFPASKTAGKAAKGKTLLVAAAESSTRVVKTRKTTRKVSTTKTVLKLKYKKTPDWCFKKSMSEEEAKHHGMVLHSAPIDGDFGTGRITGYQEYWMKPYFWLEPVGDEEEEGGDGLEEES